MIFTLSYEEIRKNESIRTYIREADKSLEALGYTEHSFAHVTMVAKGAGELLASLGYDAHTVELCRIAGFMHDIGNLVNREDHSQSGAIIAFRILDGLGMPATDLATVVSAIGNHDEGSGTPVSAVAAALILADKSDVRRSRVRNFDMATFDIHDRVNYSVTSSELAVTEDKKAIELHLTIDTEISPVMSYFEIFLGRMIMCKKAAEHLGCAFRLYVNDQQLF
ncbi:MAG: HD domain-containing protein [Clostridia bacterium]|nr:HD domain-containing protein [Clostridia bacterium]